MGGKVGAKNSAFFLMGALKKQGDFYAPLFLISLQYTVVVFVVFVFGGGGRELRYREF